MKISNLIFLSIFIILILFSFTTFINFKQSEEVRANAEYFSMSSAMMRQSNQFQRNILYMERGLRSYIMTGESDFLQTYDSASIENDLLFKELDSLMYTNPVQLEKLYAIRDLYAEWVDRFAKPMRNVAMAADTTPGNALSGSFYKNQQAIREEEEMNRNLQQKFRELINAEYTNRERRREILESSEWKTKVISFSLTAFSIAIGAVIAFVLARHITGRLLKMVNMANSIAQGNYQVQVKDSGNDELSELTRSLNHMAETLSANISLLKRKNQELDQFAHIVSHDLKAPLRGIDNVISWIEEDHSQDLPPKVHEYLQLIKGRIVRSENLIQGLLAYAKIGKEIQPKEVIELNILLREVLENLPMKPGLLITIQPDLPTIYSEKLPLMQIFTNLISNALKYNDRQQGNIRVYAREERKHYVFFVEDDGPGIARSYHEKIFVIFQTLQERDSFESTGVGLAIVKKILDDRREEINVESEPGKGSVFSFTWSKF